MIKELIDIVGSDRVFDSPDILERYSKDMSFVHPIRPRCVVMPKDLDEIIKIVHWANKTSTPLVPVSSGPPRFRGDTIPSVGGAVIVDLSKMKEIIRIDVRNKIAIIEPGVTFSELIPVLAEKGLMPFMPLMPRQSKSVVTSYLETEPITTPTFQWDTQDPLSCLEVIFGSGELFRTGEAVGPGDLEDQWKVGKTQNRGIGPTYVDFTKLLQRTQGTIGIVTWASIYCRSIPKLREAFLVPAEKLERLIGLVYKLMWRRLGNICLIVNNCNLASILAEKSADIMSLREDLPSWILVFSIEPCGLFYEKRAEFEREEFINLAQSFGLEPMLKLAGIHGDEVLKVISGVSSDTYWKLRLKGGCQELFFLTTLDKTPELVRKFYELAARYKYDLKDIGVYIQPVVQGTSAHCEFDLYYNPQIEEEVEVVKKVFYEGAKILARLGAFFARPYGPLRDITYPYISAPFIIAQRKIKSIFDPNNIMNPGKLYFG